MTVGDFDKYAKPEIERRFLLDSVPPAARDPVEITDRYLDGGHLRLRTVEQHGAPTIHKLGHKRRREPDDPTAIFHTSIRLTEAEHALLARLPGTVLRKTRYRIELEGRAAVVDALHGPHEGVILLEVGFGPAEDPSDYTPPSWVGNETDLTGADLAG